MLRIADDIHDLCEFGGLSLGCKLLPLLLDPKRLPFWLYMPNLIGYVRVVALLVAMAEVLEVLGYLLWVQQILILMI